MAAVDGVPTERGSNPTVRRELLKRSFGRVVGHDGLGRPATSLAIADLLRTAHLSVRDAAGVLGVSRSVVHRARLSRKPAELAS